MARSMTFITTQKTGSDILFNLMPDPFLRALQLRSSRSNAAWSGVSLK
jgi:hypothetical protein